MTSQAWFATTGHCEGCGQPGTYCLCTDSNPCPCRELHEMGSGRKPEALAAFLDAPPVEVSADQESLFGELP